MWVRLLCLRYTVKKLTSRAVNALTNTLLALVLVVLGVVCFLPSSTHVSGLEERVHYRGKSECGVSLMFNVCWGTEQVEGILSVLATYGAKATFFLGGSWADDNVACVKKIVEAGHEIGTHGYFHRDHTTLGYDENVKEIERSVQFLRQASGVDVSLFAPPSGAYDEYTVNAAEYLGLETVMWSRDTVDWRDKDEETCYLRATKNLEAGELVLMHPMEHTLAALPRILEYCKQHSLTVITVSENIGTT